MTGERFLNLVEVRALLGGVSASTVYRWIEASDFPEPRRLGVNVSRWLASEVEAWIASRPRASEAA